MAERRMFAKTIVLSDAFLDMPLGARCLYMTLGMVADDDGFVNNPRSIMRQCGATDDDMKILIAKRFVLIFDDGVIVIKHWRINNYLRADRYTETKYKKDKSLLSVEENGSYTIPNNTGVPGGIPDGIPNTGYPGKDSIDKNSIGQNNTMFICDERGGGSGPDFGKEFEVLWDRYPRKEGKIDARRHYIKARKDGTSFEAVKAGLENYIECLRRERRDPTKIKIGSTWFCQRCWEDEYITTNQKETTLKDVASSIDLSNFFNKG